MLNQFKFITFNKKIMEQKASNIKQKKWYNKDIFPLIPNIETRKSDEHNTSGFTFKWLFFTIWTIDSPSFEVAIVADTHWGIGFIGLLPFVRWVIAIPCPEKLGMWISRNLSRSRRFYR